MIRLSVGLTVAEAADQHLHVEVGGRIDPGDCRALPELQADLDGHVRRH